jgi:undecaprenyl-diphosphatase
MLDVWQALLLGALQGITELFPISSLGHTVLLPSLIGWEIKQSDPAFLSFLVATHFATALVLLGFYAGEWVRIVGAMLGSLRDREITTPDARLGWLLVVATIPAGLLGLLFEEQVRTLFASARIAAVFLTINGVVLFGAELLRRRAAGAASPAPAALPWKTAIAIGTAQASALLPGLSRTGATISGGLLAGLSHADAAHFAFLMATPIIFAAAALKLPALFAQGSAETVGPTLVGMLASGIAAFLSVRYLTRYFRVNTLTPFAIYCFLAGLISFAVLLLR